jgi:hypothetical protein
MSFCSSLVGNSGRIPRNSTYSGVQKSRILNSKENMTSNGKDKAHASGEKSNNDANNQEDEIL